MTTAIAKTKPGPVKLTTPRAIEMQKVLQEELEVREVVRQFIGTQMAEGTDYGPMPGVKPKEGEPPRLVLFKPGAEKLFDLFRCKPVYRILAKSVEPAIGLYYYEIRCRAVLRETDVVLNEGLGSASSYESRYRYRAGERTCPTCKKVATLRRSATEFYCWRRLDGCGATYALDAPTILEQKVGRVQNPDLADVANTVLKIAKKRAQVDAAIGLARVSDLFTSDLEDLPLLEVALPGGAPVATEAKPPAATPTTVNEPARQAATTQPARQEAQRPPAPTPVPDEMERARAFARAARDRQIFDGAMATGIAAKAFHGWAETILTHTYSTNGEWTDGDRQVLEDEVVARRELSGGNGVAPANGAGAPPKPAPSATANGENLSPAQKAARTRRQRLEAARSEAVRADRTPLTVAAPAAKTQAEPTRVTDTAERDRQIFDEALATGLSREAFHGWAEKMIGRRYSSNADWTEDDRCHLEEDLLARREEMKRINGRENLQNSPSPSRNGSGRLVPVKQP
jgi:hypothetical protein